MTNLVISAGRNAKEVPCLTGMRGCAALLVFCYHAPWLADIRRAPCWGIEWWHRLLDASDAGVGLFFILSGFLLSLPFWKSLTSNSAKPNLQIYFIRRIARIMPGYWLALFIYQIGHDRTWTAQGIAVFVLSFFGLDSWFHLGWEFRNHPVLWTVSIELMFYVLLPLIFWMMVSILRKISNSKFRDILIISLVVGVTCFSGYLYEWIAKLAAPVLPDFFLGRGKASHAISESVFHYFAWFGTGIFAGLLRNKMENNQFSWIKDHANLIYILGLLWVAGTMSVAGEGEWRVKDLTRFGAWPWGSGGFLLLVIAAPYSQWALHLFSMWPLRKVGDLSYGIYLWHVPILYAVYRGSLGIYFNGEGKLWIGGAAGFAGTVVASQLMFVLIERPAIRWARGVTSFREAFRSLK